MTLSLYSQRLSLDHRTDDNLEPVAKKKYSAMNATKEKGLCCIAQIRLPILNGLILLVFLFLLRVRNFFVKIRKQMILDQGALEHS